MGDVHSNEKPGRRRSLTELTLGWIAERLRKTEEIKAAVRSGAYQVNSEKVAASIVSDPSEK